MTPGPRWNSSLALDGWMAHSLTHPLCSSFFMQLLRLAKMEDPAKRKIELEALHQVQRSEPDGLVLL